MSLVRAKFRVLQVTQGWEGNTVVKLGPVKRGKDQDTENDFFWKFTPSGEAEVAFSAGQANPLKVGAFYFLDFERSAVQTPWRLSGVDWQDYAVTVAFYGQEPSVMGRPCYWASLKMGLSREATGAREVLQPHGSFWDIKFSEAE